MKYNLQNSTKIIRRPITKMSIEHRITKAIYTY